MFVKVKNMAGGEPVLITISKNATIDELKSKVKERMEVELPCQRLYYRGKQLDGSNSLFDYSININEVIQLMVRQPLAETKQQENVPITEQLVRAALEDTKAEVEIETTKATEVEEKKTKVMEEEAKSEFFLVGDLVDIMDTEPGEGGTPGAWYEGKVARITREEGEAVVAGCDGLTYYVAYDAYDGDDYTAKLEQLLPRARKVLKARELTEGLEVLVPYNTSDPERRGEWYRAVVQTARPALLCTVLAGVDLVPLPDCTIAYPAEVMRLEVAEKVGDRTEPLDRPPAQERKHPEKCDRCHDNEKKKCKDCGCQRCGGKDEPDMQVVCDECQGAFHLACIQLDVMPEEDEWFCPDCKNVDDTVKAGDKMKMGKKKAKMASKQAAEDGKKKRDWGGGFATVGRTKTCSKVDKNHFGPIPGVEVGMAWLFRVQISEEGIHRPHVAGIAGSAAEGCPSLVLGGGYEDDVDDGDTFTYTGSGGRDLSGNKRTAPQSSDQELTRTNAAIAVNCAAKFDDKNGADAGEDWRKGKPIRVVRGYKGAKHSKYAPQEGCRYDGIYKVVKYWPQKGKAGFVVWRYLMRRDDPAPAPWTKEGRAKMEAGGYAEIVKPPNHEEYMKEKARELEEKQAKKLAEKAEKKGGVKRKGMAEDEEDDPPKIKKTKEKETKAKPAKEKAPAVTVSYKMTSPERALVKADTANSRLWDEVLADTFLNKKELTDKVEETFCCIICQDLVFQPVTIPCGHNLCRSCLSRSFKAGVYSCPSCRAEMDKDYEKPVNSALRAALLALFPGYETGR